MSFYDDLIFRSLNVRMADYGCTNTDDLLTLGELTGERGFQETRLRLQQQSQKEARRREGLP